MSCAKLVPLRERKGQLKLVPFRARKVQLKLVPLRERKGQLKLVPLRERKGRAVRFCISKGGCNQESRSAASEKVEGQGSSNSNSSECSGGPTSYIYSASVACRGWASRQVTTNVTRRQATHRVARLAPLHSLRYAATSR
ncbi:hypothetical protein GW17_00038334 [Ensete ventricosum]|nr:hypothetical protein GW17_00038334 [Ensete ventricosum]